MIDLFAQPCPADQRELWLAVAEALAVKPRMRPSDWAEANVVLESSQAALAGPFKCSWKPWTRDLHDATFDSPEKRGVIGVKPAQVGWSQGTINLVLYLAERDPGPMLYVTDTKEKAREFSDEYMMPTIRRSPGLAPKFDDPGEDRSVLKFHKPFRGGVIDLHGAGSETGMTSVGRRHVFLDEYELSSSNYLNKTGGDLLRSATDRLTTYRDVGTLNAFGHPKYEDEGIDALYKALSDCRRWVFDCPHCTGVVEPCWDRVEFAEVEGPEARPEPESARFLCPHCRREITDTQRARATWPARLREGGTGRFESELEPVEAAKREYIGLKLNRLADPEVSVRELARRYCLCRTEEALLEFFNKGLGEPRKKSRAVVTIDSIRAIIQTASPILVPGGDRGVRFLAAGVDVQSPRHNPNLYFGAYAFAADGQVYCVHLEIARGWTHLFQLLTTVGVRISGGGELGVRLCTIDAGWETGQVLDNCRRTGLYSPHDGSPVQLLPVRYVPQLNADNVATMAPDRKRVNPMRPELGMVDYVYLHRHSWVDRGMRRVSDARLKVLCPVPAEFAAQFMANVLRPAPKQHGLDQDREEWWKPKELRDDWAQTLFYAEAGAALRLNLDTIHAFTTAPGEAAPVQQEGGGGDDGYMERFRQRPRGGWWNR